MADKFSKMVVDLDDPCTNAFAVTANNSTTFSQPTRALWVGTGGNVKVMFADKNNANNVVTISGVQSGTLLPIRVQRVYSGNTTASGILGLY